ILDVPKNELDAIIELVPRIMENTVKLDVPLKVDYSYGASWFDAKYFCRSVNVSDLLVVKTIRKTLKKLVLNKKITDIEVYLGKMIKHPDDIEHFKHIVINQTIHDVKRKGKFLIFELDTDMLVSHLRMEGKYSVSQTGLPRDKHTHVIFNFTDVTSLNYN